MDNKQPQETGIQTTERVKSDPAGLRRVSRFSRRRFLQTTAITSPILLSVKSPAAWAGGAYKDKCSLTTYMSGNSSHPHNCQVKCKSPDYWKKCLRGHKDLKVVREKLHDKSCYKGTKFHSICPNQHAHWEQDPSVNADWQFRISEAKSDNPSVYECLGSKNYNMCIEFKHKESDEEKQCYVLGEKVPEFHQCVVSGYLNGMFHPSPVSYICNENQVKNACSDAINQSIYKMLMALKKGEFDPDDMEYSRPLKELASHLNQWDDFWDS